MKVGTLNDLEVGQRFKELRGSSTNQWVAERMTEKGFPWYQQTAWKVERGHRVLRLNEAIALCEIFDQPLDWFTGSSAEGKDTERRAKAKKLLEDLERLI
jgi:hypothetical protein